MQKAVIAGFARTPFTFAKKGALASLRPDDLAAILLASLLERAELPPEVIEDVLMGCAFPEGEQGDNVARISALLAGFPTDVAGATINRFCGSSMYAAHIAAGQIAIGAGDAFIACGVESMSRVPQGGFSFSPNPRFPSSNTSGGDLPWQAYISMGATAENVARRYNIGRDRQDQFAFDSHMKAASAQASGNFIDEIVPVATPTGIVDADGCLRPSTSLAALADLRPAFQAGGTVTAGTSSPLTDGAAAILVTSEAFAARYDLQVIGRIKATAVSGVDPAFMGMGPVSASIKALSRAGLSIDDIDVVEINEAFASQAIACVEELGIDWGKVNRDGGGISVGHPLGATGARITGKAAQILKRDGGRFALATQCIGGGQGIATIIEAVD